ncbi:uncharacterized protein LOC127010041 [Eriocheir sinensis]|uniref:uncharacterized protein LOC127010041 n=1 Tax=Eriocheir sinensis TaxID=95602 RepID=UPI0021C9428D|nr:uncharacterized protein LOC127010041 [Eriocheir sinensis]
MSQLSVVAAVVMMVVVVSAAPPSSPHTSITTTTTTHLSPPDHDSPLLLRPKRRGPAPPPKSATIPYSNYRRVSGVHRPYSAWKQLASVRRYRYPLYRKRNYQPMHYDYEDDLQLPEEGNDQEAGMDYPDYPIYPRPSLFRERNIMNQEQLMEALEEEEKEAEEREKKELMLENEGYFHEVPEEDMNGPGRVAMTDNSYVNHLYGLPYSDLQRLNQMYEYGKRFEDEDVDDTEGYPPLIPPYYYVNENVPSLPVSPVATKTMAPTATGRFYDALSYVRKRATEVSPKYSEEEMPFEDAESVRAKKPQQYLTSAAGRYWRVRDEQRQQEEQQKTPSSSSSSSIRDPAMMIRRRKRNTTPTTTATSTTNSPATTQATKRRKTINTAPPTRKPKTTTTTTTKPHHRLATTTSMALTTTSAPHHRDHRSKRAFSDYFKWEKRGEDEEEEEEEEEEGDKDIDDFLTREYFKSIARSVGQKRKRMAYAEFEPEADEDKRKRKRVPSSSSTAPTLVSLQDIINNPEILQFVKDKLKEVEAVMAQEAQGTAEWPRSGTQEEAEHREMSRAVLRMDALNHMRESLSQMQRLQQEQAGRRLGGRREIQLIEQERKRAAAQREEEEEEEEEEWRRRSMEGGVGGGNQKRSVRRRLRRGDDIADLFLGNDKEECPVLWMILHSCSDVSVKVGDEGQVFLPACIKHEICYSCGASQGISGHECDAVLSSALEAACPARSLDCLAAAGSTFSTLSRPGKYDAGGTCAHDPCVIHFLESR